MQLSRTPVVFLDIQTTGAKPDNAHMLEIAWSTLASEDIHSRLVALPDTQEIPWRIQMITGIKQNEMTAAIPLADVISSFLEFMQTHAAENPVVVIHFAQFEKPFLTDAFAKLQKEIPFEILCTHEIAKRLFPNLPTRGIKGLAGYFGCPSGEFKRASNHVQATQVIWQGLITALQEKGISSLPALQEWLTQTPKAARTKYEYPLPKEKRLSLPKEPGIYRMLSRWGEVLYVGKATSLHDRVNSYFRGQKNRDTRKLEMLTQVWDLHVTVVASPLEAALLETDEIKRLNPPYNVSLKTGRREMVFFNKCFTEKSTVPDAQFSMGPFSSATPLDSILKLSQSLRDGVFQEDIFYEELPAEDIRQGFEIFCVRHNLNADDFKSMRNILALGAWWYRDLVEEEAEEEDAQNSEEEEEETPLTPKDIADKFERHFIRSAATYLRAKKLTRLLNSRIVIYAENKIELTVRGGFVDKDLAAPVKKSWEGLSIDTYDRMTVLQMEINKLSARHPVEIELAK
ncbi:MAG: GIY-YIG nuclease family protein [Bdellovibrio sp.]|nr:GIY-YIG nuclease family protein [Bdellovibrio sp.]